MTNNILLFEMRGCRSVLLIAGTAIHMQQQIETIENALGNNPSLVFDLSKALVETVCKTILNDRKIAYTNDDDVQQLFRKTIENLQLLPPDQSGARNTRQGLEKTARGLLQAVQGMAELRNEQGMASHGKDAYARPVEAVQALLVAQSADAIVHFLYNVHLNYRRDLTTTRLTFPQNPDFNDYVDEIHGGAINIFDGEYRPSEVLFEMDQEAYRVNLTDYLSQPEEPENGDSGEEAAE